MRIIGFLAFSAFLLISGVMIGSNHSSAPAVEQEILEEITNETDLVVEEVLVEQPPAQTDETSTESHKYTTTQTLANVIEKLGLWLYDGIIQFTSRIADFFLN